MKRNRTPEYYSWVNMKSRCLNPRVKEFKWYGARGITICRRWIESFDAFLADVGLRPSPASTLERVRTDGNYEPGNVRWASMREQCNNRRSNRWLVHNGERRTMAEWGRLLGINTMTLMYRLNHGMSDSEALTVPVSRSTTPLAVKTKAAQAGRDVGEEG